MSGTKWNLSALCSDLNETRVGSDDDSVFQIIPKCLLESQGLPKFASSKLEKCRAVSLGGNPDDQLGLAVESELLIFDAKMERIVHTVPFPGTIDIILWNQNILLVGLTTAEVCFLNPITYEMIDSRNVEANAESIVMRSTEGRFFTSGYIHVEGPSCKIDTVSIEGTVYGFTTSLAPDNTLDYTRLEQSNFLNSVTEHACVRVAAQTKQTITCSHFIVPGSYLYTADRRGKLSLSNIKDVGNGSFELECKNSDNILKQLRLRSTEVSVIKMMRIDGLLFTLLSSGHLEILFDDMLMATGALKLPVPNSKVYDFAIALVDQEFKLWAIFGDFKNPENTYVGIFTGASFKPQLYVQIPVAASPTADLDLDSIKQDLFSIRFNEQNSLTEEPSSMLCVCNLGVIVFQVMESTRESTLQRLLTQEKFKQANAFAEKYSIDLDIVKKARVQSCFNKLCICMDDSKMDGIFAELYSSLETISDTDFLCKFCICDVTTVFPKVEWVKKILGLGCRRAVSVARTDHGKELLLLGKKFYTFEQVLPGGSIRDWKQFCNPSHSMFQICRQFVKNEQFSYCNCVWNRHSSEFISSLELGDFAEFFWILFSKQLATPETVTLLKTILEDALDKCVEPDFDLDKGLSGILDLVKKQICFLEKSVHWPKEACTFVKILTGIFEAEIQKLREAMLGTRYDAQVDDKIIFCQKLIGKLEYYAQALRELSELIASHAIRISFQKFTQDDLREVVNALLDALSEKPEIERFVKKFLIPFASRGSLCLDYLFEAYIESVVGYVGVYANSDCIPFEEKLITLVELMSNPKRRLSAIHQMVLKWPVPWSQAVESLVTRTLDEIIPDNAEDSQECKRIQGGIATVQKQVPFQCVLQKYRLTASKLMNPSGVEMGILRVLRSGKPEAYEDCLVLVKFTGKRDADDVLLTKTRLELDKEDFQGRVEDFFPLDLPESAMTKMRDFFELPSTPLWRGMIKAPEVVARYLKAAEILNKRLEADEETEFLEMRKLVPDLDRLSVLFHPTYPFNVVDRLLLQFMKLPVDEIMKLSQRLSTVSYVSHHEIIAAVIFSIMEQCQITPALNAKLWSLLTELVKFPCVFRSPLLEDLIIDGIAALVCQNPSLTTEQQGTLESFITMVINSFDESFRDVSRAMSIHSVFMTLREHEVPLEEDFLGIVQDMLTGRGKAVSKLLEEITKLCRGLIMHGEHDLMIRIINIIILHHKNTKSIVDDPSVKSYCSKVAEQVEEKKKILIEESKHHKGTESNPHVIKLVEALCESGVYCNAYALRNRNKLKLINTLLANEEYALASDVALIFQHHDKEQWSKILQGFMNQSNTKSLKKLLNDVKNITEVWAVPELSSAWLMVSEVYPEFMNLCPIPLSPTL